MPQMKSMYDGTCATCGKKIKAGDQIDYRGKGNAHHILCVQSSLPWIEWEPKDANRLADKLHFLRKK